MEADEGRKPLFNFGFRSCEFNRTERVRVPRLTPFFFLLQQPHHPDSSTMEDTKKNKNKRGNKGVRGLRVDART